MNLLKQFHDYSINWEQEINENEWFFEEFRKSITKNLIASDAFNLISEAVKLVLEQKDEYLCTGTLFLLLDIIRIANTTEMPLLLKEEWQNLLTHVTSFGKSHIRIFNEIKDWYRIE